MEKHSSLLQHSQFSSPKQARRVEVAIPATPAVEVMLVGTEVALAGPALDAAEVMLAGTEVAAEAMQAEVAGAVRHCQRLVRRSWARPPAP